MDFFDLEHTLAVEAALAWAIGAVWVSAYDIKEHILPTRIIWPTALVVLAIYVAAAVAADSISNLGWAAAGAVGCYAGFYAIYLISTRAMGGGDVRLAGLNGLIAGWFGPAHPWIAIGLALLLSFPSALVLVAVRGPKHVSAFGPFLVAGTAVVVGIELAGLEPWG